MELLTGEPLALDLVNTRGAAYDALDEVAGFHDWLAEQAGRLTAPETPFTRADLPAVRELRGHVSAALEAARQAAPPPAGAVAALNRALRAAPPYVRLEPRGAVLVSGSRRDGPALSRLLAELAEAAAALLTDPGVGRIRACEGPQCPMLFLPAHPRRRWCSPDLCGNRVRVARYYQRHKDER
ncbi:CGNR zinc finger domain-containing protein [Nonomuraea sp. NPDC002799]